MGAESCSTAGEDKTYCLKVENQSDMAYMADIYVGSPP
jgi:hypothetical protein